MAVYPLSAAEDQLIRWGLRVVPAAAVAIIVFLGAISLASVQV